MSLSNVDYNLIKTVVQINNIYVLTTSDIIPMKYYKVVSKTDDHEEYIRVELLKVTKYKGLIETGIYSYWSYEYIFEQFFKKYQRTLINLTHHTDINEEQKYITPSSRRITIKMLKNDINEYIDNKTLRKILYESIVDTYNLIDFIHYERIQYYLMWICDNESGEFKDSSDNYNFYNFILNF